MFLPYSLRAALAEQVVCLGWDFYFTTLREHRKWESVWKYFFTLFGDTSGAEITHITFKKTNQMSFVKCFVEQPYIWPSE